MSRITPNVPYLACVRERNGRAGELALRVVCGHCGDENETLIAASGTLVIDQGSEHGLALAALWIASHTTRHDEVVRRREPIEAELLRSARAPIDLSCDHMVSAPCALCAAERARMGPIRLTAEERRVVLTALQAWLRAEYGAPPWPPDCLASTVLAKVLG